MGVSRDSYYANPTFDFYFKFKLPKPNKDGIIIERDNQGRILFSIVL